MQQSICVRSQLRIHLYLHLCSHLFRLLCHRRLATKSKLLERESERPRPEQLSKKILSRLYTWYCSTNIRILTSTFCLKNDHGSQTFQTPWTEQRQTSPLETVWRGDCRTGLRCKASDRSRHIYPQQREPARRKRKMRGAALAWSPRLIATFSPLSS